jgi:hypothetical protein
VKSTRDKLKWLEEINKFNELYLGKKTVLAATAQLLNRPFRPLDK